MRHHPQNESLSKYSKIIKSHKLKISDSQNIDVFTFLKNVDSIVSGNSSILLEAALQNVFPIYYLGSKSDFLYRHDRYDKYDYVRNKVAYPADDLQSLGSILEKVIKRKPEIRKYAKYYCDTLGTINEGKSAELAVNFIKGSIIN